MKKEIKD